MQGGKLSLPGFDCKMKPGFDYQCCASICHRVAGQLQLRVQPHFCAVHVRFACQLRVLVTNFGASPLMFAGFFLPSFLPALGLNPCGDPCSGPFQSHSARTSALPPNILPFNNMVKTNTWSHYMKFFFFH